MTSPIDFQKPLEAVKDMFAMQAETINKTVALQQKSGQELMQFFQMEAEKAKVLKTPEDVVKFNVEANSALFNLIKHQNEAFTALAAEAGQKTLEQLQKMGAGQK